MSKLAQVVALLPDKTVRKGSQGYPQQSQPCFGGDSVDSKNPHDDPRCLPDSTGGTRPGWGGSEMGDAMEDMEDEYP